MKYVKMLLAALLIALIPLAALAQAPQKVLARATQIIGIQESNHNYGCAETDTNGKSSLGFIQWNAGRAAALLKKIIAQDEASAVALLGERLTEQLKNATGCQLSSADLKTVSALLKSPAGVAVQNAQAAADISSYIELAMGLGMKEPNALCYFADVAHQVGSGAIKKYHVLAAEQAGGYAHVTLDHLYEAALTYATHTKARRTRVYKLLKENPIDSGSVPESQAPTAIKATIGGVIALKVGETRTIAVALKPANAQTTLQWRSSAEQVAQVTDGLITARAPGKAVITVETANGLKAQVKVAVAPGSVKRLTLSGDRTMQKGARQTLEATLTPANAAALKWKSGNPRIASVNQQGVVIAKKKGTAVIACKAGKIVARFKIRVNE